MTYIISIAYAVVLISAVFVILRWGMVRCNGPTPMGIVSLVALLFTAGLDMGLIMLPLGEFPVYAAEPEFAFSNPLAVEFGMWGPLVWMMYFLSTFYFVIFEPRLKIFEIPLVRYVYNLTVVATCAFSCFLFYTALPNYIPGIPDWGRWGLAIFVIAVSVYTSADLHILRWLALTSTWTFVCLIFCALIAGTFFYSGVGLSVLGKEVGLLSDYFPKITHFITPINAYHEFYLFWWFSWSIMIGQFVSNFIGNLRTWTLAFAMIILPSIPLAAWFCVLHVYYTYNITIPAWLNWFMVLVGIVFVVNSLDALIRLYSRNLGLSVERLGKPFYYAMNFGVQFALVLAYQFTPFKIEWVGVMVIGIYAVIYAILLLNPSHIRAAVAEARGL